MALYFIRHAETLGNVANLWVGRKDEGITKCKKTARGIATSQLKPPCVRVSENLQERDFGRFEGEIKTDEHRKLLEQDPSVESLTSIKSRLGEVMVEADSLPGDILLVSHSAVFRCLIENMHYVSIPERRSLDNLEYVRLVHKQIR